MARAGAVVRVRAGEAVGRILRSVRAFSDGRGGNTPYDGIGDAFGWFCVALSPGRPGWSF